jgi:hypothetical protein
MGSVSKVSSRIPRRRRGRAQEPDVDPPGGQRGELLGVEAFADRDLDSRVGVPVGPDDRGQQGHRHGGKDRDADLSPVALRGGQPVPASSEGVQP